MAFRGKNNRDNVGGRNGRNHGGVGKGPEAVVRDILTGKQDINNQRTALHFFDCMCRHKDPLELLFHLADGTNDAKTILKRALALASDETHFEESTLRFLEMLGREDLSAGSAKSCVDECYRIAFETPGLMSIILSLLQKQKLSDLDTVAWFLVSLARSHPPAREDSKVINIAEMLRNDADSEAVSCMMNLLLPTQLQQRSIDVSLVHSLDELRSLKPQHDNDFPFDYRKIQILPTPDEIKSGLAANGAVPFTSPDLISCGGEAAMLDRQFRLLREDMLEPMREEIANLLEANKKNNKEKSGKVSLNRAFQNPQLVGLAMEPRPCVLIRVKMPPALEKRLKNMKNKKEQSVFMDSVGKRVLERDSMLVFLNHNDVVCVGLVVRRVKDEIVTENGCLTVGVMFHDEHLKRMLMMMETRAGKNGQVIGSSIGTVMLQTSSSYFSYEPVLQRLQKMDHIPFKEELVLQENPLPAENVYEVPKSIANKVSSDPGQLLGVQRAMQDRMVLIQGPPGTGKTFVGVQIALALLKRNPRERILCLCYTNHALDDFLTSLHEAGLSTGNMVRLGSSPKIAEHLKSRCLSELVEASFSRNQTMRFAKLKAEQKELMEEMNTLSKKLERKVWGPNWWRTASEFLNSNGYFSELDQLSISATMDGMRAVGRKGKGIDDDYLWKEWYAGRENSLTQQADNQTGIWASNLAERRKVVEKWQSEWIQPTIDQLTCAMRAYQRTTIELDMLRLESKVPVACEAQVIGATTTSAAKSMRLLEQIRPTIVIVEEAAEILEASVLTSINRCVSKLIMIGDHKQLRPKLECYSLRKESGKGINFDVSLFERLALQDNFPIISLTVQHRMRPEISSLIRSTTYPNLRDHESVLGRNNLRGVTRGSNVIFLNHNMQESNDEDRALLGANSKINLHEVHLVVAVLKYMMQQGYSRSDFVILTPYLGQLVQIQQALKAVVAVNINDMDRKDLKKCDVDLERSAKPKDNDKETDSDDESDDSDANTSSAKQVDAVRVSTVDNFQGEEAKIIIGSLVRCNDENDIGFVSGAERVNVLLSRARDGMILIGSESTLRNARSSKGREVWNKIFRVLHENNQVFDGFPAECCNHGTHPDEPLVNAAAFEKHVPDGGCCQPCGAALPNCPEGHRCTRKCHPMTYNGVDVHLSVKCEALVPALCPEGHPVDRVCSNEMPQKCTKRVSYACPQGHPGSRVCSMPQPKKCSTCVKLEKEQKILEEKLRIEAEKQNKELEDKQIEKQKLEAQLQEANQRRANDLAVQQLEEENRSIALLLAQSMEPLPRRQKKLKSVKDSASVDSTVTVVPIPTLNEVSTLKVDAVQAPAVMSCTSRNTMTGNHVTETLQSCHLPFAASGVSMQIIDGEHDMQQYVEDSNNEHYNDSTTDSHDTCTNLFVGCDTAVDMEYEENGLDVLDIDKLNLWIRMADKEEWCEMCGLFEEKQCSTVMQLLATSMEVLAMHHLGGADTGHIQKLILEYNTAMDASWDYPIVLAVVYYVMFIVLRDSSQHKSTAIVRGQDFLALLNKCEGLPSSWERHVREGVTKAIAIKPSKPVRLGETIESASDEWNRCKANTRASEAGKSTNASSNSNKKSSDTPSEAMDDLMKMIGLESVKRGMLNEYHRINIAKEQGMSAGAASYNTRYDGNPGTGKTTVARIYGQFLIDVGILPDTSIVKETTGARLISEGISGLKKLLEEIKEAEGGVVFVDEAYQLNPQQDQAGRQVLDFILTHAERLDGEYGKLVWIFAGYAHNMDKLFEHNPGLPSRFPTKFIFEDYSDDELLKIFNSLLERGRSEAPKLPKSNTKTTGAGKTSTQSQNNQSSQISQALYYSGIAYMYPDTMDAWGNKWTWDMNLSTYHDPYGNVNGYGPKGHSGYMPAPFASPSNPIIDPKGNKWTFSASDKIWSSSSGKKQSHYPGSPKPQATTTQSKASFTVSDPKWARIAIRRLGARRGAVGFGNARAVRVLFDTVLKRQSERITRQKARGENPNIFELVRDDLLGPKATMAALEESKAWKKLLAMEGLTEVKEAIRQLMAVVIQNAEKEEAEKPLDLVMLNKTFVGNPGTGKTTVAKLYGEILCDLGMLSKGEFILKNPSDFLGSVLGSSEAQTRAILNQAMGCVLVIDEAYLLNPSTGSKGSTGSDPYKSAVLDTIVEQVQARPGDDRAVLLLGYRKEMDELKSAANPGLSRRFNMENPIEFKDYDDNALVRILRENARAAQIDLPLKNAIYAIKLLAKERAGPHFGNAGAVATLFSGAKQQRARRLSNAPLVKQDNVMIKEDFSGGAIKVSGGEADIFADLVGCENILEKLKEYQNTILCAKKQGKDPKKLVEFNFLFVGSPGTGKTTVARRMGKLFHSLGLLPTDEVVERKASSLITGFAGQSGRATNDEMMKARGKVLFIDEAYQLNPEKGGSYMQEVVDEIVQCLTSKELYNQIVVILAGYESDIDDMLKVNQGLKSRFSEKLYFNDFSVAVMRDMIMKQFDGLGLKVERDVLEALPLLLQQLKDAPNFGNGRDVDTLSKRVYKQYANRAARVSGCPPLSVEDCSAGLTSLLQSKMESGEAVKSPSPNNNQRQQQMSQFAAPPKPAATTTAIVQKQVEPVIEQNESGDQPDQENDFLCALQTILDQRGLNNKDGVQHLSTLSIDSAEINALANEMASKLGMSLDEAKAMIWNWQLAQADVRAKMEAQEEEMEKAKLQKRKARVPIWRCGVCGRANKPYIACYVQPYVVRYDEIDV